MKFLIYSALSTGVFFIVDIIFKQKKHPLTYLGIFILILGIYYSTSKLEASEYDVVNHNEYQINDESYTHAYLPAVQLEVTMIKALLDNQNALTQEKRKSFEEKVKFHKENAERT